MKEGSFDVSVGFYADSTSSSATYTLYDSNNSVLAGPKTISQSGTGAWREELLGTNINLSNGAYVLASNIGANTNVDTIKFRYVPEAAVTTWSTGAYANNADISKVLSIPDAMFLAVTVTGSTESCYSQYCDHFIIYNSSGNQIADYSGSISTRFVIPGSSITARLISDAGVNASGVVISIAAFDPGTVYWQTGAYSNYADISQVLSIPGAPSLIVNVFGSTEYCWYSCDHFMIYDSSGNRQRDYSGLISETFTVAGSSITARLTSDARINTGGVMISVKAGSFVASDASKADGVLNCLEQLVPNIFSPHAITQNVPQADLSTAYIRHYGNNMQAVWKSEFWYYINDWGWTDWGSIDTLKRQYCPNAW